MSEVETHTHVLTHAARTMQDTEEQKETQRGKHSWLPLSLLTPAVGCNLHSNKTWQHCAELIFEVVIFSTPFLSLFTAVFCGNAFLCVFFPFQTFILNVFVSQLPRHQPSAVIVCHQSLIWKWSLKYNSHPKWSTQPGTNRFNNLFAHISHFPAASDPAV